MNQDQPTCDAIVSFADAKVWVEPLLLTKPDDLIQQALDTEPAVLGVAVHIAANLEERLKRQGVPSAFCDNISTRCILAGAIAIVLMQKGNAKLWKDFIEGGGDE